MYDFDTVIDRRPFHAAKWGRPSGASPAADRELIPLWVADMDFACPPEVARAVAERAAHPVYGYPAIPEGFYEAYRSWAARRYGVEAARDWLCFSPGVVTGLALAVNAFTRSGEGVVIQPPVYHPFAWVIARNGRRIVENRLALSGGRYAIDFDDLEARVDAGTKAIIFCSPHNPVGRVWSRDELERVAELAVRRDLVLVSDEIHADIVYGGNRHHCALGLPREVLDRLVVFHAPSKTFNVAGLQASIAVIPNADLRSRFEAEAARAGLDGSNVFGTWAAEAAWRRGEPWLEELLAYLEGNLRFVREFVSSRLPALEVLPIEGTYLAWIDFRRSGLEGAERKGVLHSFLVERAGLWCDEGSKFGAGGEGFVRLNFACPRSVLAEALGRLERALGA